MNLLSFILTPRQRARLEAAMEALRAENQKYKEENLELKKENRELKAQLQKKGKK